MRAKPRLRIPQRVVALVELTALATVDDLLSFQSARFSSSYSSSYSSSSSSSTRATTRLINARAMTTTTTKRRRRRRRRSQRRRKRKRCSRRRHLGEKSRKKELRLSVCVCACARASFQTYLMTCVRPLRARESFGVSESRDILLQKKGRYTCELIPTKHTHSLSLSRETS